MPYPDHETVPLLYLLSAVWRQVEDEDSEEGDAHAGDDEVHRVEERLPPHRDVEGYVQIGLVTARVELHIPAKKKLHDLLCHDDVSQTEVSPT